MSMPARIRARALRLRVLILSTTLCFGLGAFLSQAFVVQPTYTATAVLSVQNMPADAQLIQFSMVTATTLAFQPAVLNVAASTLPDMTSQQLVPHLAVSVMGVSYLIGITATDTSPARAASEANSVATALCTELPKLAPNTFKPGTLLIAQYAVAPPAQSSIPKALRTSGLVFLSSLLLWLAVLWFYEESKRNHGSPVTDRMMVEASRQDMLRLTRKDDVA